jgi:hypothetical protein
MQHLVTLQWRPETEYQGVVRILATVVMDYRTFWSKVAALSVTVRNSTGDRGEED